MPLPPYSRLAHLPLPVLPHSLQSSRRIEGICFGRGGRTSCWSASRAPRFSAQFVDRVPSRAFPSAGCCRTASRHVVGLSWVHPPGTSQKCWRSTLKSSSSSLQWWRTSAHPSLSGLRGSPSCLHYTSSFRSLLRWSVGCYGSVGGFFVGSVHLGHSGSFGGAICPMVVGQASWRTLSIGLLDGGSRCTIWTFARFCTCLCTCPASLCSAPFATLMAHDILTSVTRSSRTVGQSVGHRVKYQVGLSIYHRWWYALNSYGWPISTPVYPLPPLLALHHGWLSCWASYQRSVSWPCQPAGFRYQYFGIRNAWRKI